MHGTQNVKFALYTLAFKPPTNESKVLNQVNAGDKDHASLHCFQMGVISAASNNRIIRFVAGKWISVHQF